MPASGIGALPPSGRGPHHLSVPTDDPSHHADTATRHAVRTNLDDLPRAPTGTWTLDMLTGDLHQELAPAAARRSLRFVLYHECVAWLEPAQARRVKRVLARALSSAIDAAALGSSFRVDITCVLALGGRWLQTHATADGGTVLWLSIPLES
jgi:hypothetical protein